MGREKVEIAGVGELTSSCQMLAHLVFCPSKFGIFAHNNVEVYQNSQINVYGSCSFEPAKKLNGLILYVMLNSNMINKKAW